MERISNNSLDGKGSAVLDQEVSTVAETDKVATPTVANAVAPEKQRQTARVAKPEADAATEEQKSPPPDAGKEESKPKNKQRRRLLFAGLGVLAVVGGVFGIRWFEYASVHESTDDAYVTADVHPVSSRINGTVNGLLVNDNQHVQAGQLLVTLDPRDYQVEAQQAEASLESAQRQANAALSQINLSSQTALGNTQNAQGNVGSASASISTAIAAVKAAQAGVPAAQAQVAQANANLQKAQADYNRYSVLYQQGVIASQQMDTARAAYQVDLAQRNSAIQAVAQAQASLAQAQENVTKAQAQLAASKGGLLQAKATGVQTQVSRSQYQAAQAAIAQSQASLHNAQLQLSYTNIYAPTSGTVGNKSAEVGERLQPGTPLMAITQDDEWVVANYKETQLAKMRVGQQVEIHVDAIPDRNFIGYVNSFSPGSGATFALLPSDNATGNFTKIVQRIPVKIVFDPNSIRGYQSRIVPGLSVETSVNVK